MKFQSGNTIIEFEEPVEEEVKIEPRNKKELDILEGSFINKATFDENGDLWLYLDGDKIISVNHSCYGGVHLHKEENE